MSAREQASKRKPDLVRFAEDDLFGLGDDVVQ
jgi:hypothetical protein